MVVTFDVIDKFLVKADDLIRDYSYDSLFKITSKLSSSYCCNTFNEVDVYMVECFKDAVTEFFITRNYDNKYIKSELDSIVSAIIIPRKVSLHVLRNRMLSVESDKNNLGDLSVLPSDVLIEICNKLVM